MPPAVTADSLLTLCRGYADRVLALHRDRFGDADLLATYLAPALDDVVYHQTPGGRDIVLANLASEQAFLRLLTGLSRLTGEPQYHEQALALCRHALARRRKGMLPWGNHAYEFAENAFHPTFTDGTRLTGKVMERDGYYGKAGTVFRPRAADGMLWRAAVLA
jgi:hypothetical protein